jgi:hypothetical protein
MTDYRLRNHDLLYVNRGRQPLNWRILAIFGSIAVTITLGVSAYLVDQFNPASTGFNPASPALIALQPEAPAVVQLDTPATTGSGS